MSSTILVTGGAGFVGSHLIEALLAASGDSTIVSVDNYLTGTDANHHDHDRIRYLRGSTVDIKRIWAEEGLPDPSKVYHLGEYSRIVQSFGEFGRTWELNAHGTKEIVEFCHDRQARLVYAGSSSKFGNDGRDEHLNPYAWTKAKNTELIRNYAEWYGLDHVITYFYSVYGPRHIRTGRYATVIGIFEHQYLTGAPLTVVSPGTQTRDFTHVGDIVDGILLCAESGSGDGYMIGAEEEWSINDVADAFGCERVMIPPLRGERVNGRADSRKVRELGWTPRWHLGRYVSEFVRHNRPGSRA